MTRSLVLRLGLTLHLLACSASVTPTPASSDPSRYGSHKTKKATMLIYQIDSDRRTLDLGEPLQLVATLTNQSQKRLAIEEGALFRYVNHEKLPSREGEFGAGGQVIGDSPAGAGGERKMTFIPSGNSLTRTLDLSKLLSSVITSPGFYKISLDYCYFGPKSVEGASAPVGCVRSNEIEFEVAAK